jgi:D-inositol-3-phosphate glycosyltransferase
VKVFGHIRNIGPGELPLPVESSRLQAENSRGIYGAGAAGQAFLRALFRYGDFGEFHFYLPNGYLAREPAFRKHYLGPLRDDQRIKFFELRSLRENLGKYDYQVFHQPEGLDIGGWIYLRNRLGSSKVPITAITHTNSYQFLLETHLLQLVLQGGEPWDSIVCPSSAAKEVLKKLLAHVKKSLRPRQDNPFGYRGRLDIIPLGVDSELYAPRPKKAVRKQLNLPPDACIFLWLGRFSPYDKADLAPLLVAFAKAFAGKGHPKVTLLLVGEDSRHSYAGQLEALAGSLGIRGRVIVRANPSSMACALYYSAADVFVCPSDNIQESFGLTVVEAMSSGLPVICSDWDGYRDTVKHGETGFRVPTYWMKCDDDICDFAPVSAWRLDHFFLSQTVCVGVPQLVGYMRLLASKRRLREKMAAQARSHAIENFQWKGVINKYEKLWDKLHRASLKAQGKLPRRPSFRPAYFDIYKSHATKIFSDDTHLQSSPSRSYLDAVFHQHPELNSAITLGLCRAILKFAREATQISALRAAVGRKRVSEERFRIHLMWLIKYNLLQLRPR